MSKKFSIHLIDDNPDMQQLVQKALFPPTGSSIDLIDFEYRQSVGMAIKDYEGQELDFPNIALVDINFDSLDKVTFSDTEREPLKGLELIRFIARNTSKTKIFAFTGQGNNDKIVKELGRLDFLDNTIDKSSSIGMRRIQYELQKWAKHILKNIALNYRKELENLPDAFIDVEVGNTGFTLPCLLAGWGDIRKKHVVEVQSIVREILLAETRATEFRGIWRDSDSPERRALEEYRNLKRTDYERELRDINKMAFNLLIEFIRISEKDNFGEAKEVLSHQFSQQMFCVTGQIGITPHALKHKLIGRRTMAAFTYYYGTKNGLSLSNCAVLLRDCELPIIEPLLYDRTGILLDNLTVKKKIENRTASIINTALGLVNGGSGMINIDNTYLLPEEKDFLLFVGNLEGETYALHFANFLRDLDFVPDIALHLQGNPLINMSDLKRFMDSIMKASHPEETTRNLLDDFFHSDYLTSVPEANRRAIFQLYGIPV